MHDYEVEIADSVRSALERAAEGFDVLVSDIGLPDGTGRDLMRQLSARGPVRAVALTGYGTDQGVRSNNDAGFCHHLTKPVDPDELLAAVSELAQSPPPEQVSPGRRQRAGAAAARSPRFQAPFPFARGGRPASFAPHPSSRSPRRAEKEGARWPHRSSKPACPSW